MDEARGRGAGLLPRLSQHALRQRRPGAALAAPLSDETLERIRAEFADILEGGTFEQTDALPDEASDAHLAALPRLRFHFDRRSLGRLRLLIDTINRDGEGPGAA